VVGTEAARRLLLVEDDPVYGRALIRALSGGGFSTHWAQTCAEARRMIANGPSLSYALVDDRLGDGFGLDLLPLLDALRPKPCIALVSAHLSAERAMAALRADRLALPKPVTPAGVLELLALLERRQLVRSASLDRLVFGAFVLDAEGLRAPDGLRPLCASSIALLRYLLMREPDGYLKAADIAVRLLNRRDSAGHDLVRRQVANLRRSLGPHAWLVASVAKRGYRIDPRAFGTGARVTDSAIEFTHLSRISVLQRSEHDRSGGSGDAGQDAG
jgi:DNA-binding response OmpR family regulator